MNSLGGEPATRELLRRFRRVTIMGLGLFGGGAGAARYFAELGARVTVTDAADADRLSRSVALLDGLDIEFVLGRHRERDFLEADLVVANQAVRPDNPLLEAARAAGAAVTTETGLALSLNRSPWAAVTGSSGKSTTAALLAAMLREADARTLFGGNIGGDLMTRVEGRPADAPLVVELSSYQLTYIAGDLAAGRVAPPLAATVTNITPNHLDWHRDIEEYAEAKRAVVRFQRPDQWAVLNVADARLRTWAESAPARVIACSPDDPGTPSACYRDGDEIALRIDRARALSLPLAAFRLPGGHNIANALEATAAAHVMGVPAAAARAAFSSFSGLPHRLEHVAEARGRRFINDSKATTPDAAILALEAIEGPKTLIAGGYDKKSPFDDLGRAIQERAFALVLLGASAGRLREAVDAASAGRPAGMPPLRIVMAGEDFRGAVTAAYEATPEGGTVLLSPACASWGMFVNYEARGDLFRDIARELEGTC